jgi:hypothetical protein
MDPDPDPDAYPDPAIQDVFLLITTFRRYIYSTSFFKDKSRKKVFLDARRIRIRISD